MNTKCSTFRTAAVMAGLCIMPIVMIGGCQKKVTKAAAVVPEVPKPQAPPAPAPEPPPQPAAQPSMNESELERQAKEALQNIYFDFNKSDIKPEAESRLNIVGRFLINHMTIRILIAGNCDERGSESYNLALGQRRAESAKGFLTAFGVAGDRLQTVSYGKDRLAFPNCMDEECHSKNRRDEFSVQGSVPVSSDDDVK